MNAFISLYIASLKEFLRDRMALFWTLAFPVFFIMLFGIIFSGGGDNTYALGVAVQDQGPLAQQIGSAFDQVGVFKVTHGSSDELLEKFRHGDLSAVVVIPDGVSAAAAAGKQSNLDVYYDPSNQVNSQIVLTVIGKVVDGFDQAISQRPTLLAVNPVTITASNLRAIDFLLPGILAMSLMQLGLFATAPALVQLREQQVLRRIGATPLPRITLLGAQVAHRLTIGLTQTVIIVLVGIFVFNIHIVGNWLELVGFVLTGAVMFVAMGYLIAGLAKTQESVNGITQLINFPMMFLSGLFFSVDAMPAWIRPVVNVMPLSYLADALRQIMVGATPTYTLGLDIAVLGVWLIVCTFFAVRLFRWE